MGISIKLMKDENLANFLYDSKIKYYSLDVLSHIKTILMTKLEQNLENMRHRTQTI